MLYLVLSTKSLNGSRGAAVTFKKSPAVKLFSFFFLDTWILLKKKMIVKKN